MKNTNEKIRNAKTVDTVTHTHTHTHTHTQVFFNR